MARMQHSAIIGHYECKTEELTATLQKEDPVHGGLFVTVVVWQCAAIFQLLACTELPLLVKGDASLILDLGLQILSDSVTGLHVHGNGRPWPNELVLRV